LEEIAKCKQQNGEGGTCGQPAFGLCSDSDVALCKDHYETGGDA
jgi:hypothetical protein